MNRNSTGNLWIRGAFVLLFVGVVAILPELLSSCSETTGPAAGVVTAQSAVVSGTIYGKEGSAAAQIIPGALVSIRSSLYNDDTLTDAQGNYRFVIQFPDSITTSITATLSATKSPNYVLQTENIFIKPGSNVSAPFTLVSSDTTAITAPSGRATSIVFVSASRTTANVQGSGGVTSVNYIFTVLDSSGTPVDSLHKVEVHFAIQPSIGAGEHLSNDSALTNANPNQRGQVTTTLTTGTKSGIVQIVASVQTATIHLSTSSPSLPIYGGPPVASHFTMGASSINFPALNISGLRDTVLVQLGDKMGNPVPTGTAVYFSSTSGIIQPAAYTDSSGRANVLLTSGAPVSPNGLAYIYAQTVADSSKLLEDSTLIFITGATLLTPLDTTLTVPAGGQLPFAFRVYDQYFHPLAAGTNITAVLSGTGASALQFSGTTNVTLSDTHLDSLTRFSVVMKDTTHTVPSPNRPFTLTINITSPNGNFSHTYSGVLLGTGGSGGVAHASAKVASIEIFTVSDTIISVQGTGAHQSSAITFTALDRSGNPIPQDSATISFQLEGGLDATLFPTSAMTDGEGHVQTVLSSGTKAGVAEIVAWVDTAAGKMVQSSPVPVTIASGLPDSNHFTVAVSKFNIPGRYHAGLADSITVFVGDKYDNPVQSRTSVYFTTKGGLINPAAFTNTVGIASSTLLTSYPEPVNGFDTVTVSTVDQNGIKFQRTANVVFSGLPVIKIDSASYSVPNGGSRVFHYIVSDDYAPVNLFQPGNPLSSGTTISATLVGPNAGNAKLLGDVSITLGDYLYNGNETTNFTATIADSVLYVLVNQSVTLQISVSGPNGSVYTDIPVTLLKAVSPPPSIVKRIAIVNNPLPTVTVAGTTDNDSTQIEFEIQDANGNQLPAAGILLNYNVSGESGTTRPTSSATDANGHTFVEFIAGKNIGTASISAKTTTDIISDVQSVNVLAGRASSKTTSLLVTIPGDTTQINNFPGAVVGPTNIIGAVEIKVKDLYGNPVAFGTPVRLSATSGHVTDTVYTDANGAANTPWFGGGNPNPNALVTISVIGDGGKIVADTAVMSYSGAPILKFAPATIGSKFQFYPGMDTTISFTAMDAAGNPLAQGESLFVSISGPGASQLNITGLTTFILPDTRNNSYTTFSFNLADTNTTVFTNAALTLSLRASGPNGLAQAGSLTGSMSGVPPPPFRVVTSTVSSNRISVYNVGGIDTTRYTIQLKDTLGNNVNTPGVPVVFMLNGISGSLSKQEDVTNLNGSASTLFTSATLAETVSVSAQAGSYSAPAQQIIIQAGPPVQTFFHLAVEGNDGKPHVNFPGISSAGSQIGTASVILKDTYGNVCQEFTPVKFASNAGSLIPPVAYSAGNGLAQAIWFGGNPAPAAAYITAEADTGSGAGAKQVARDSAAILYTGAPVITATFPASLRHGIDTIITYTVADANGNPLSAGNIINVTVSGAGAGLIELLGNVSVTTGDTKDPTTTHYSVEIKDTNSVVTNLQNLSFSISVNGPNGSKAYSSNSTMQGAPISAVSGLALSSIEASTLTVKGGGGQETSLLTYQLYDSLGNRIRRDSVTITFVGLGVPNSFTPASAMTDTGGKVQTLFHSDTVAGIVRVVATAIPSGIQSSNLKITIVGGVPSQNNFTFVLSGVSSNIAQVNYPGEMPVIEQIGEAQVQVGDRYSNPVPQGTPVYFTTNAGQIVGSAQTNAIGFAEVSWYSGKPDPVGGVAIVKASTPGVNGTTVMDSSIVAYTGQAIITGGVPNGFVLHNGIDSTFTYQVKDANGNPITAGSQISVVASGPGAASLILSGNTSVVMPDSKLPSAGNFAFTVQDTNTSLSSTRNVSFTIAVTQSANGTASAPSAVTLTGIPPAAVHYASIAGLVLTVSPAAQLSVKGAGGAPEFTLIGYQLRDSLNRPITEPGVKVSFASAGVVGSFTPDTVLTDSTGTAQTIFRSDTVAGIVQIHATVLNSNISSSITKLVIVGGLPAQSNFTFILTGTSGTTAQVNFPGAMPSLQQIGTARVQVGDRYGNPVPAGTPVYFSTNAGLIQGSAQTDGNGSASVEWFGGNPVPPGGIATVKANTLGYNGTSVRDSSTVVYSGQAIISGGLANGFVFHAGIDTVFTYSVKDANGNPIAANSVISVLPSGPGAATLLLNGDVQVVMPDTMSARVFSVHVRDTNSVITLTRAITFTIQVTQSPNGTPSQSVAGTLQGVTSSNPHYATIASLALTGMSQSTISIANAGGTQASLLTYQLRDSVNNPILEAGIKVWLKMTNGFDGKFSPDTATTDVTGSAQVQFLSDTAAGIAQFQALVVGGIATSSVSNIVVVGGKPSQSHFTFNMTRPGLTGPKVNFPGAIPGVQLIGIAQLQVGDKYGNPVPPGTAVSFTTNAGLIQGSSVTDVNGAATVNWFSGNPIPSGENAQVTASAVGDSGKSVSTTLSLTYSGQATVANALQNAIALHHGIDTTISYTVADSAGQPIAAGSTIQVSISGAAATAFLLSGAVNVTTPDTRNTANEVYQVQIQDTSTTVVASRTFTMTITVTGANGSATSTVTDTLHGSAGSTGSGQGFATIARLNLTSIGATQLVVKGGGGAESSLLTYEIDDSLGNIIRKSGVQVNFTETGAEGTFTPQSAMTDSTGHVQTTFSSDTTAGPVQVTATVASLPLVTSTQARLVIVGGRPSLKYFTFTLGRPGSTTSNVNFPGGVSAGLSIGTAAAQLGDRYGNPVPAGTNVYFTTNAGVIQGSATTNANAQASVSWFGGNPIPPSEAAIVTVSAISDTGQFYVNDTVTYSGQIQLTAQIPSNYSIAGGGSAQYGYKLADLLRQPIAQGTQVTVTATGAGASNLVLAGAVSFTTVDTRDTNKTNFVFSVQDTTHTSTVVRAVTITIAASGPNGSVTQSFIGQVQPTGQTSSRTRLPASIALISLSTQDLQVLGTGGLETAQFTFQVRDSVGVPVDSAYQVLFTVDNAPGGTYISPISGLNDSATGDINAVLHAGTVAGVVQVVATVISPTGMITSTPVLVTVHSGLPDQAHFTLFPSAHNFAGLDLVNVMDTMNVLVGDKWSNPVRDSTAVYFSTKNGVILPAGYTNTSGLASVALISGNPLPLGSDTAAGAGGPGYTWVSARTAGDSDLVVKDSTIICFSGIPHLSSSSPATFTMSYGDCEAFNVTVEDELGHPIAPGSVLTLVLQTTATTTVYPISVPDALYPGVNTTQFSLEFCVPPLPAGSSATLQTITVDMQVTWMGRVYTLEIANGSVD